MVVVLRLNDGKGEIRFVVEQVVGLFGFSTPDSLPPDNHAPIGEKCLLPDLGHQIPVAADDGRSDELRPNIRLGELIFVQISGVPNCHKDGSMIHAARFREAKWSGCQSTPTGNPCFRQTVVRPGIRASPQMAQRDSPDAMRSQICSAMVCFS